MRFEKEYLALKSKMMQAFKETCQKTKELEEEVRLLSIKKIADDENKALLVALREQIDNSQYGNTASIF
jgi:hypothetical protein